jgi:hypothetical protein
MAGTLCHFLLIWSYVQPFALAKRAPLREAAADSRSDQKSDAELQGIKR